MVKYLFTWKKKPNRTERECEQHYRTEHTRLAKIALGQIPGFRRYVQNKVLNHTVYNHNQWGRPQEATPEFDRFVELYFDDKEAMIKAFDTPEMRACFDDHVHFMDTGIPANIKVYEIEEVIPLEKKK